jgi:ribosomal-protein-alanine N-acetyltransferase
MQITIEDASIRHLDRLNEIEKECFKEEAFTKSQIAQLLADYNSIGLVAREAGVIVGFIIGMIHVGGNSSSGHILTIDVSPSHRGKGTGELLLREIERIFRQKRVKTVSLEVREDNAVALSLYRKLGYREAGMLKNYYGKAHGVYLKKVLA